MKKMNNSTKKGFTIVELSLSLIFLSILLVAIATLIIRMTSIYKKGMALKSLNVAGGELVDELNRAISSSPVVNPASLCGGSFTCIYRQQTATLSSGETVPTNGIFCTGKYSYIWNTGYALNTSSNTGTGQVTFSDGHSHIATVRNNSNSSQTRTNFKLLRFRDDGRYMCQNHNSSNDDNYVMPYNPNDKTRVDELMDNSDDYNNLVLYDLQIYKPTYQVITNHAFYSGSFIMATLTGDVNITSVGDYCSADYSNSLNTEFPYCAVNKFNFASRATGVSL